LLETFSPEDYLVLKFLSTLTPKKVVT